MNIRQSRRLVSLPGGFTLIEVLLVVALLAVLLTLALPQYRQFIERSHRVEAIRMLTTAAACQERHRARTGLYDTTRCINTSSEGHYRLSIEPEEVSSSETYTLSATPVETSSSDFCGSLRLDQAGDRSISGPDGNRWRCWSGR